MRNTPEIWAEAMPRPQPEDNKYSRGQVAVLGGVDMPGAACLAADGAARVGAGLVTIISPCLSLMQKLRCHDPLPVYKTFRPYIIVRGGTNLPEFIESAQKKGRVCNVIGPGLGDAEFPVIRKIALAVLGQGAPVVLDADGLNAFQGQVEALAGFSTGKLVLTPHEGEFAKLFSSLAPLLKEDRVNAAKQAAENIGAVVVLKGHETVIACPGRETMVNDNAPPDLATAGSGDVLAGMIAGLMAQGMNGFDAASAAVWMHGAAARAFGAGLVASDLPGLIPRVFQEVLGIRSKVR